jgi:putative MATE family efflux protein
MLLGDDKVFYRRILAIALPIALQNLINFGVNAMDTIMLGMLGEVQLSAAAIANQLTFMYMILSFGIARGSGVLIAQYWGKKDVPQIKKVMAFMYRAVMALAVAFTALAVFAPGFVMSLFIKDQQVIAEGIVYLRVIGYACLFSGITNVTIGALRSVGTVHISVIVYSISLIVNVSLNWVLIFGHLGAPRLGILGAAIATLIARIVETCIILVFLFRYEKKLAIRLRELMQFDSAVVGGFVRYALPVLLNEMLWTSGNAAMTAVIGHMGREFVAANSISSVLFQLAGTAIFGMSSAAATIIGNTIGEGDYEKAAHRGNAFVLLGAGIGLVMGLVLFAVRVPVIGFYHISELAKSYAMGITAVASVYILFQAVSMICMMGVLRGGGDTRFVMVADVLFMWLIGIPLGAWAGLKLGWPVPMVYALLKCEDLFKTAIVLWRIPSRRWIRDVTR